MIEAIGLTSADRDDTDNHRPAELMVERRGLELAGWMTDVDAAGSPALRSVTADLDQLDLR
ncbi:hypothetical protein ACFWB0_17895 [Rhodococcus sp. NPDC060086]|uniref:hypothetical protein n=1 Tax=unclassified Rhodococcus (in: high G+C Gram-positive bacteria) TaxID=192944 RepID=UPI00365DE286